MFWKCSMFRAGSVQKRLQSELKMVSRLILKHCVTSSLCNCNFKNPPFPRFPQLPPGRPPHTLWLFHGSYCDSFWLKHNLLAPDHLLHAAPQCSVPQQQQHPSALPHGRQPPRNYLVFVPEIPLAAHLSDPNTLLCVSIRLQCRALQMGWNVSSILLGRVIWFTEVLLQYNNYFCILM